MKRLSILFIFILTLGALAQAQAQRNRKLSAKKPTAEKVNVEIQTQLSLMFEAKELQNLIATAPNIRFKAFEEINVANFKNFKIKDKAVEVLDTASLSHHDNLNYFYITAWGDVLNMLNVEIVHKESQTKVKVLLTKDNNKWTFGTSELLSEKKAEDKKPTSGRKSLKRRG